MHARKRVFKAGSVVEVGAHHLGALGGKSLGLVFVGITGDRAAVETAGAVIQNGRTESAALGTGRTSDGDDLVGHRCSDLVSSSTAATI